jgi:hypothetical protein
MLTINGDIGGREANSVCLWGGGNRSSGVKKAEVVRTPPPSIVGGTMRFIFGFNFGLQFGA